MCIMLVSGHGIKEQCIQYVKLRVSNHPKMQRLIGCLREVVTYKNQTTGGPLARIGQGTSSLWKIFYCMQFLSYTLYSSMLLLSYSYIISSMCTQ